MCFWSCFILTLLRTLFFLSRTDTPMLIAVNLFFPSQWSAAAFALVGSPDSYLHPRQSPRKQSSIRAKPNDADFKSIKNHIVGCVWTPASLQEELLADLFTVKPHTPPFQDQKFVNHERSFSSFTRVCSHPVLAGTTGWRQGAPWGWDNALICGERDDTGLDKGKKNLQWPTYSISYASLRRGVWADWKSSCRSCFPPMKRTANLTLLPQSCPPPSRVQEPVTRGFMPIFTNHRKMFPQLCHGGSSLSVTGWQDEQRHFSEHKEPELAPSWGAGEQGRTCIC